MTVALAVQPLAPRTETGLFPFLHRVDLPGQLDTGRTMAPVGTVAQRPLVPLLAGGVVHHVSLVAIRERNHAFEVRIVRNGRIQQPYRSKPAVTQVDAVALRPHRRQEPVSAALHYFFSKVRPPNFRPKPGPVRDSVSPICFRFQVSALSPRASIFEAHDPSSRLRLQLVVEGEMIEIDQQSGEVGLLGLFRERVGHGITGILVHNLDHSRRPVGELAQGSHLVPTIFGQLKTLTIQNQRVHRLSVSLGSTGPCVFIRALTTSHRINRFSPLPGLGLCAFFRLLPLNPLPQLLSVVPFPVRLGCFWILVEEPFLLPEAPPEFLGSLDLLQPLRMLVLPLASDIDRHQRERLRVGLNPLPAATPLLGVIVLPRPRDDRSSIPVVERFLAGIHGPFDVAVRRLRRGNSVVRVFTKTVSTSGVPTVNEIPPGLFPLPLEHLFPGTLFFSRGSLRPPHRQGRRPCFICPTGIDQIHFAPRQFRDRVAPQQVARLSLSEGRNQRGGGSWGAPDPRGHSVF